MTLQWLPLPRNAGLDACLRGVSDAARGVWLLLLCATDDHGNITGAGAQSFEDVVDAVAGMGSGAHLDELRGMALVLCDVGPVRRLHLPHVLRWREELTPGAETPSKSPTPPETSPTPPAASPAVVVLRGAERRLRALWSKNGKDTPEERAAWLESPKGERFLRREQERGVAVTVAWALSLSRTAEDNRGRFAPKATATTLPADRDNHGDNPDEGCRRDGDNHGDNLGSSPTPPLPEKRPEDKEKSGSEGARAHGDNPPCNGDNLRGDNFAPTVTTPAPPRCPTVERTPPRLPAVEAREVFAHLRGGTNLGGGGLTLSVTKDHEKELNAIFKGFEEDRAPWTLTSVKRLARHVGAGHLRDGWRPQLAHLRGKDGSWTTLLSLYDEAQTCARCAEVEAPPRPREPASAPTPSFLPPSEVQAAARAWRESQRNMQPSTPEKIADG